ncbi:MAG: helix-turn-helix domain-containing protein [Lawsonibacter sp.]
MFTRDQLLNTIWGYEFDGASRTVDVHIRTLRQKLGAPAPLHRDCARRWLQDQRTIRRGLPDGE